MQHHYTRRTRSTNCRFDLLLLDENEDYITDCVGSVLHAPHQMRKHNDAVREPMVHAKGRIRICSKSIVFDPDDMNKPIVKIQMKAVTDIGRHDDDDDDDDDDKYSVSNNDNTALVTGAGKGAGPSGAAEDGHGVSIHMNSVRERIGIVNTAKSGKKFIYVCATSFLLMRSHGRHSPYESVKVARTEDVLSGMWAFSIAYATVYEIYHPLHTIYNVCRLPPSQCESKLALMQTQREDEMSFDVCHLVEHTEDILVDVPAVQLKPLMREPGRFVLTTRRMYFQPLHDI